MNIKQLTTIKKKQKKCSCEHKVEHIRAHFCCCGKNWGVSGGSGRSGGAGFGGGGGGVFVQRGV